LAEFLGSSTLPVKVAPEGSPYQYYKIIADRKIESTGEGGTYYKITVERNIESDEMPSINDSIFLFHESINGIVEVGDATSTQVVTKQELDSDVREYVVYNEPTSSDSLFVDNMVLGSVLDYQNLELDIAFTNPAKSKLKLISRNPGNWAEGLEICIAKPESFYANSKSPQTHVTKYAFEGISVDDLFEYAPTDTQFAIIIRYNGSIVELFTVDTVKGKKDSNNKSTYVENVINTYSCIVTFY